VLLVFFLVIVVLNFEVMLDTFVNITADPLVYNALASNQSRSVAVPDGFFLVI